MALFLLVLVAISGCRLFDRDSPSEMDADLDMKDPMTRANFGLLGVEFFESGNNAKRWNINSNYAEIHRSENYVFLKTVAADFHAERTGNVIHTLSDQGRSALDKNQVDLSGNVKIKARTGYEFAMNTLVYDGEAHAFRSNDEVLMQGPQSTRPSMILRGTGLVGDIDREHFILRYRVTARKRFRGDDWLKVKSQQGEFFTEEQHAIFEGKVTTHLPSGLAVESDVMDLTSTQDREIMEARGTVTMLFKEKRGWAQNAYFEAGGDRIILEGNAKVESKRSEVRGRRITLFTMDDRVEVSEAEGRVQN
ncbi:MAG: LPS export ABC transporter periplasmic protein LptC [Deltaproteobacteria bacterium]|nr:LPS export ABC transporter periplasmic protein LptC [Deltaproteobacteria bacterium]MBI3295578.1 LPS export ABC transporter periplasmic protein LptC [Deltaproteobacteria bacterium]